MLTSLVDFMYVHCVLPSNHIFADGVDAQNFLPFMCSTPDCFGIFAPEIVKEAVAPPFLPIIVAVLSRIFRASAALSANAAPNTKVKSVNMINLFIVYLSFSEICVMQLTYCLSCPKSLSNEFSSEMSTSRGFEPCAAPTIPTRSI